MCDTEVRHSVENGAYFWWRGGLTAQEERYEDADEQQERGDGHQNGHQYAPIETARFVRIAGLYARAHTSYFIWTRVG